jgi:uncharacterized protein (TIGR02145 family)
VGEYITVETIKFTGTPMYDLVLKHSGGSMITQQVNSPFIVPSSYTLQTFTDKTGAPGIITPLTYTLTASASGFCEGATTGVSFALQGTQKGVKYQLYRDATLASTLTGTGGAETFSSTFNTAGTYTARTVAEGAYQATPMSGSHPIKSNKLPAPPFIAKPADVCQNGGNIVFTATDYSGSLTWTSYTGGAQSGNSVTFASTATGTKTVTARSAQTYTNAPPCYSATVTQSATVNICCDAPGDTVNFTAFNPCSANTGSFWYLTDTREADYSNTQTYKVKLLQDNHYWMVQNMKFGSKCNKTTLSAANKSNQTKKITGLTDKEYYGDCRSNPQSGAGYLYNWAAAINKPSAYNEGSEQGCSGTVPVSSGTTTQACQGICPSGWHIPTGNTNGEFKALHDKIGGCSTSNDNCWDAASAWEGVYGGRADPGATPYSQGTAGLYWSSTNRTSCCPYILYFTSNSVTFASSENFGKETARSVRCVKNY